MALAGMMLVGLQATTAEARVEQSLLDFDREISSSSSTLSHFEQMKERHDLLDLSLVEAEIMCDAGDDLSCGQLSFLNKIEYLRAYEGFELLERLDQIYDQVPYVYDSEQWGQGDYWASPAEFLEAGGGDCEEYAIAKYFTLRELGWDENDLRIVVLWDENIRNYHAVLLVWHEGQEWLLDNAIHEVVPGHSVAHYKPLHSVSEAGSWAYNNRNEAPYLTSAGRR